MLKGKKTRVCLAAGLAVILLLSLAAGAFGATNVTSRNLQAIFRDIQLMINGHIWQTEEEPFIVGGRTYVPLRVVSEALGASVNWDSKNNLVSVSNAAHQEMENLIARLEQLENENALLKAQIEELGGTTPDAEKTLRDLAERLKNKYSKLEDVRIKDIRLTGNKNEVNVNIDVNLGEYEKEWEVLTDNKIKNWLTEMFVDIQNYYSEDTIIGGRIKDTKSQDDLVVFSKHRFQAAKINYKDKDHRHGRGLGVDDVEDIWRNESFAIAEMSFNVASIEYDTGSDEINLRLVAADAFAADWEKADSDDARASIKEICKNIASDFALEAAKAPKAVNVRVYDRIPTLLDSFKYIVNDDILR